MKFLLGFSILIFSCTLLTAQNRQDSLDIKQSALNYIESQHVPNSDQMSSALHPRLVKRTFWKDKATGKDFLRETTAESMILLAASYNKNGDKFPASPKKEVILLDVSSATASIKLIADDWIDYMHLAKLNGAWKIVNVLWQYHTIKHE